MWPDFSSLPWIEQVLIEWTEQPFLFTDNNSGMTKTTGMDRTAFSLHWQQQDDKDYRNEQPFLFTGNNRMTKTTGMDCSVFLFTDNNRMTKTTGMD